MFAAGELAMTAHDLALWDESLIAQTVLKPESYKQMFTEVKLKDGKGTHYGLGVYVMDRDGHRSIEHSGEVSGFVADNEVLVDDGVAVAVLTNQDANGAASTISHLAAATLVGDAIATREAYGNALVRIGGADQRVVAMDGDTKNSWPRRWPTSARAWRRWACRSSSARPASSCAAA